MSDRNDEPKNALAAWQAADPTKYEQAQVCVARANLSHRRILDHLRTSLQETRAAGDALIAAKTLVPHGAWLPYLEANFRGSRGTAARYMRIARRWPRIQKYYLSNGHLTVDSALRLLVEEDDDDDTAAVPSAPPGPKDDNTGANGRDTEEDRERLTEEEERENALEHLTVQVRMALAPFPLEALRKCASSDDAEEELERVLQEWAASWRGARPSHRPVRHDDEDLTLVDRIPCRLDRRRPW